jgi:hypothetical protein
MLLFLVVAVGVAGFKQTRHFGGREGLFSGSWREVFGVGEGEVVVLQFLLDVEPVELVIDRVIRFLGHRHKGVTGVFKPLFLFSLLFGQLLELATIIYTSSLSDFSALSRFIR